MSFLSIVKTIAIDVEHGVFVAAGLGEAAAPLVTALNPAAGAVLALVSGVVISLEQLIPDKGKGAVKKPIGLAILKANGAALDPAQAAALIDALVLLFKLLAHETMQTPVVPGEPAK